jgi:predicted unusual protein kinase regulating ubiquinone biosynthesis (AarF/ABC1/UbiB family)
VALPLKPRLLKRYRDIAEVLIRYSRSDLFRSLARDPFAVESDAASSNRKTAEAERFAADLERLGPTFIKLGQLLSTRSDLLPSAYLDALSRLQDKVEPFSAEEAGRIFEDEVGVRISKAFLEFDREPIAAASLAQVHRALLRDGRLVAVKIQRPGLRKRVADDLEALGEIADFADAHSESARRLQVRDVFTELKRVLVSELDFQNEARNLVNIGANLEEFERVIVPEPVEDFTTSRVLTMDLVRGRKITEVGPLARLEIDGGALADELFRAYLKQILVDGIFHADPHPGNVLMSDDNRIALIDLGMVARVTPRTQEHLLQLLMAVADGRSDDAARIGMLIGDRDDEFDERTYRRQVAEIVNSTRDSSLSEIKVGRMIMQVTRVATATGLKHPIELTLLGKTLLNLDQVAAILDPDFNPDAAVRNHAPQLVQQRLSQDMTPGNVFSTLLELRDFAQEFPRRVNRILDAVADNELEINVRAFDESRLMSGVHKIANRITMGLVLSALIVGAALLMRVETPFRILGYPGLAIICFLLAFGGGLALLWAILRDEA